MERIIKISVANLILLMSACSNKESLQVEKTANVNIEVVKERETTEYIENNGILSAEFVKNYAFKVPGRIASIPVKKGTKVRKGQLLAAIENLEYELAFQDAEQMLTQAKEAFLESEAYYSKLEDTQKAGGLSQTEYKKAWLDMEVKRADYERAKTNLKMQEQQLRDCMLRADMNGTVLDAFFKAGELTDAGTVVMIVRNEKPVAEISVNAKELKKISLGDSALIAIAAEELRGEVVSIAEIPNFETLTYNVQISINDGFGLRNGLYVGMPLSTKIYTEIVSITSVPIAAICSDGEDFVYCASKDRAVAKTIQKGKIYGTNIQVSGLTNGDSLIVKGIKNINPGMKINIK